MTEQESRRTLKRDAFLAACIMGLAFGGLYLAKQLPEKEEEVELTTEDEIPFYPLNGAFTCEYYKAKTQVLEGISWYEVSETSRGWNWTFSMEDGTAIFYTQTAGQFCYVIHVGEEE